MVKEVLSYNLRDYVNIPKELIGRKVSYTYGSSYSNNLPIIDEIVSVGKVSFKIKSEPSKNFRINDGCEKGGNTYSRNYCKLISDEEAEKISRNKLYNDSMKDSNDFIRNQYNTSRILLTESNVNILKEVVELLKKIERKGFKNGLHIM